MKYIISTVYKVLQLKTSVDRDEFEADFPNRQILLLLEYGSY